MSNLRQEDGFVLLVFGCEEISRATLEDINNSLKLIKARMFDFLN